MSLIRGIHIKKVTISIMLLAAIALCEMSSGQSHPASAPVKLSFTLSKETTRIVSPLRADGTVDYVAAINAQTSAGVTRDNNAAIDMIEVLGPDVLDASVREQICRALDIKITGPGPLLDTTMAGDRKYVHIQSKPWQSSDYPELSSWLRDNREALERFVAATKKPRYYVPPIISDENQCAMEPVVGAFRPYRAAAQILALRANLAIGEGRVQDAWTDIRAIYRLSALLNQGPTLMERMVALSCSSVADRTTWNLAISSKLDATTAKALLAELPGPQTAPSVIGAIDQSERATLLDIICRVAVLPPDKGLSLLERSISLNSSLTSSAPASKDASPQSVKVWAQATEDIEWDDVLRRANKHYDDRIAVMKLPNSRERNESLAEMEGWTRKTTHVLAMAMWIPEAELDAEVGKVNPDLAVQARELFNASREVRTQQVVELFLSLFTPTLGGAQVLVDINITGRQLSFIALALAAYRAEQGAYPVRLSDLSPTYLKDVPKDSFDEGKEFIYKSTRNGYSLYSIGRNGQDDGGKDQAKGGDDIVVSAEN